MPRAMPLTPIGHTDPDPFPFCNLYSWMSRHLGIWAEVLNFQTLRQLDNAIPLGGCGSMVCVVA